MAAEALKSLAITNADATPVVFSTGGIGAPARLMSISGKVTATTATTVGSTYQMVRVPSNIIPKRLFIKLDATVTEFDADIGWYYSTEPSGGHTTLTAVNTTVGSQFFGAAIVLDADITFVEHSSGLLPTSAMLGKELWDACGLTVDPGGNFDLVLTSTDTTTGAPVIYAELWYVVVGG